MSLANVLCLVGIFLVLLVWARQSGKQSSDIKHAIEDIGAKAAAAATNAETAATAAATAHAGITRLETAISALPCHECPIVAPRAK
jgi:hypothetical protein